MTDPFSQFMAGGDLPASALSWLLDTFATPFFEKAKKLSKGVWDEQQERIRWRKALQSYGKSMLNHYGNLRILAKLHLKPTSSSGAVCVIESKPDKHRLTDANH